MTSTRHSPNRGPAAAADNRRAILHAARDLFAQVGYKVPLQTIARQAGVGQGVLYRHFPNRMDLAIAVFEENFAELEQIADDPSPEAFDKLWNRLVAVMVESVGFVEMAIEASRTTQSDYDGSDRLAVLIERTLAQAKTAGLVRPDRDPRDVVVGAIMIYGIVVSTDPPQRAATVERAKSLLQPW